MGLLMTTCFLMLFLLFVISEAAAATYYASPSGSGTACSTAVPCTAAYASGRAVAGDTVVLQDGTYTGSSGMVIPKHSGADDSHRITIRAENDGKAIVNGEYVDGRRPLYIKNLSYITVEGIRFIKGGLDNIAYIYGSSHIELKRLSVGYGTDSTKTSSSTNNVTAITVIYGNNNLVEDCIIYPYFRVGINIYESDYTTVRRNWVGTTNYPGRPGYGTDSLAYGIQLYGANHNTVENNIVTMPEQRTPWPEIGIWVFANTYNNNGPNYNKIYGNVVYAGLSSSSGGFEWGLGVKSAQHLIQGNSFINNVTIGNKRGFFQRGDSNLTVKNLVIADSLTAEYIESEDTSYTKDADWAMNGTISNSVILNTPSEPALQQYDSTLASRYNTFYNTRGNYFGSILDKTGDNNADPGYDNDTYGDGAYLMYPDALAGTGISGSNRGAEILYDSLTTTPLWPWPMEDRICKETGYSVTYEKGYAGCPNGGGLWKTLNGVYAASDATPPPTTSTPTLAGDTQAPTVPTNVKATAVSSSQINITWTASTDNIGVAGYKVYRNGALAAVSNTLSDSDSGLNASTTYAYTVAAYDAAGNISAKSAPISLTTPSTTDTYISDLQWVGTPTNGWGPAEKDMSNGEKAAEDGGTITLNGVTYAKGLGVHANSQVTYNLGGNYSRFVSDIGVDDEVGSHGSVAFQVWADGVKMYDSGLMTGSSATKTVNVDVTGVSQLQLIVTDGGDNIDYDHADWAGAYLTADTTTSTPTPTPTPTLTPTPTPSPTSSSTATSTYMSDLAWVGTPTNGWGPAEKDMSNGDKAAGDGLPITLNGVTYTKGLGVHANSLVTYNLGGNYSRFVSDIGVDDEVGSHGSVVFQVWADGVEIYDSSLMTGSSATKTVNVDVTGVNQLQLVVTDGGDNIDYDHADWAGAYLTADTTSAPTLTPTPTPTSSSTATSTYMSDLAWVGTPTNGWGPAEKDMSNGDKAAGDGLPITLNGVTYTKGLGVHANSQITYNLGGNYSRFISYIGVDDEVGSHGSVVFQVWADGVEIYDSSLMTGSSATKTVNVDVTGVNQLQLVVTDGGDNIDYDHADWAGAYLTSYN
jgi:NPCBM/NEW2 domain/Fibronectin type III domain/Right handed beta helix region